MGITAAYFVAVGIKRDATLGTTLFESESKPLNEFPVDFFLNRMWLAALL